MHPTDVSDPRYYHKVVDCQWACPAHTDVPEYIRLIAQGRFDEAYLVNRESNVFPGSMSLMEVLREFLRSYHHPFLK
jgi:hypothetical protein